MKTVTPEQLAKAYTELYPDELESLNNTPEQCLEHITETLGNWLGDYSKDPAKKIRGANWYGKVTTALFLALNIKQPKTVKAMLEALQ